MTRATVGRYFLVAFVLPFGVMALFTVLSATPATTRLTFTARPYGRILSDTLCLEPLLSNLKISAVVMMAALVQEYSVTQWPARMLPRLRARPWCSWASSRPCLRASCR